MNINNLQRVKTSLDLRDRLLENYYTASLTEFKRVPGLLDSEAGLSSSLNLAPDLAFNGKATLTLPLFRVALNPRFTRPFYAVPRTSAARTASG